MVAGYHGYHADLLELRQKFGISVKGATLKRIMDIARSLNLNCRALRAEIHELKDLRLPAVLHWNFNHFVVLKKVTSKGIVVHNPALGERVYALTELGKHFTGIAIELTPSINFQAKKAGKRLRLADFWQQLTGFKRSLLQILLLSFMIQCFALASPFYMQLVVDDVLIKQDQDLLLALAAGFLCLTLISIGTTALRGVASLYLVNQLTLNIGTSLFNHLIRLPMAFFYKRHMGDIVSRFNSYKPVQDFITGSALTVLLDGVMAITTLMMIFIYSPLLSWICLASLALYCTIRLIWFGPLRNRTNETITAQAKQDSNFMESIRSISTIKNFSREAERAGQWQNTYIETLNAGIRVGRLAIAYEVVDGVLAGVTNVFVIFLGAKLVITGSFTIGMLYAFMAYRNHFNGAMNSLINQLIQFLMVSLHLERTADIALSRMEEGLESPAVFSLPYDGSLQASSISFRFSTADPWVFRKLSFDLDPGEFLMIYGPSGIGKTTLVRVLAGQLAASHGSVTVDHMLIKQLGIHAYRNQSATVLEGDQLVAGSVIDNICFYDTDRDPERAQSAAKIAQIHADILLMPMGYNSLIGDMGSALSLGQQQRILIARALYREPKILFMDEGTAHLDFPTSSAIMENLRKQQITCVFISHAKALRKYADKILIMTRKGYSLHPKS